MKKRFYVSLLGLVTIFALVMSGCSLFDTSTQNVDNQQAQQQQDNANSAQTARSGIVMPVIKHSQELQNQADWYTEVNNPNHIAYLYYFTSTLVYGPFVIKGKCSSTESQLTSPTTIVNGAGIINSGAIGDPMAIPAPQPDGSYGQNEAAIFCFTENGHHLMEFAGNWIQSDIPLVGMPTVNSQPIGGK